MAITMTQNKQFQAHKTPSANSPLWDTNPKDEDKDDKKTPARRRLILGDYYVLIEELDYMTYPSPEERAKAKAAGKKAAPRPFWQVYIHLLHSKWLTVRTIKCYLHCGKRYYSDSLDFEVESARKSGPPKDRSTMLDLLVTMFKLEDRIAASTLLSDWTGGW